MKSPRRCYVKQRLAEGLMSFVRNLTLTYGKQSAIFNLANMALRAVILNVCYYLEALWFLDVNKKWRSVL